MAKERVGHLLCPQLHPSFSRPRSFHLPTACDPFHPQNAQLPTSPLMGKPGSEHHCVCLPTALRRDAWRECGLFLFGGNWRRSSR